jgi:hypothetical protein
LSSSSSHLAAAEVLAWHMPLSWQGLATARQCSWMPLLLRLRLLLRRLRLLLLLELRQRPLI